MDKFIAHILVVDDDEEIRLLVKQYLLENKFLVTTSSNAEDASKKIKNVGHQQKPSIVKGELKPKPM